MAMDCISDLILSSLKNFQLYPIAILGLSEIGNRNTVLYTETHARVPVGVDGMHSPNLLYQLGMAHPLSTRT